MRLNPAEYVVHQFGGVRPAARALGYSPSAVSRWRKTGGQVPTRARKVILAYCKRRKIDITANDLEYGRTLRRLTEIKK